MIIRIQWFESLPTHIIYSIRYVLPTYIHSAQYRTYPQASLSFHLLKYDYVASFSIICFVFFFVFYYCIRLFVDYVWYWYFVFAQCASKTWFSIILPGSTVRSVNRPYRIDSAKNTASIEHILSKWVIWANLESHFCSLIRFFAERETNGIVLLPLWWNGWSLTYRNQDHYTNCTHCTHCIWFL